MLVAPSELDEVISVTEAMRLNWRSSGVATADAIVSGLAPGRPAETEIVGKSTCGQRRDRQQPERHRTRKRNGDGQQRGGDRPVNEGR